MISLSGIVTIAVYLVVAGLIFGLLNWLIDYLAPAEPFHRFAKVVLVVLAVLVMIGILLSIVGGGFVVR